jgi:hypothetical protein
MSTTGLLPALACALVAHASGKVVVSTVPVIQQDAPVRIVSMRNTLENIVASIVLENTSNRSTSNVLIGWAIDVPTGCAAASIPTQVSSLTFPVAIPPSTSATLQDTGPKTADLIEQAHAENASLVSVEVAVLGVDFADGTRWTSSLPLGETFDKAEIEQLSHRCSNGKLVAADPAASCPTVAASAPPTAQGRYSVATTDATAVPRFGCFFFCQGTTSKIYCENHVTSCNMVVCSNPNQCPFQTCQLTYD